MEWSVGFPLLCSRTAVARGNNELIPIDLIWIGIALVVAVALCAASYFGYHRWNGRGRFTADSLYHRQRARLGFVGFSISGLLLLVLVLLLSKRCYAAL